METKKNCADGYQEKRKGDVRKKVNRCGNRSCPKKGASEENEYF